MIISAIGYNLENDNLNRVSCYRHNIEELNMYKIFLSFSNVKGYRSVRASIF